MKPASSPIYILKTTCLLGADYPACRCTTLLKTKQPARRMRSCRLDAALREVLHCDGWQAEAKRLFVLSWSNPQIWEHPGERGRSSCGSPGPHLLLGLFTKHAACSSLGSPGISAAPLPDGLPGRSMGAEREKKFKTNKQTAQKSIVLVLASISYTCV